MKTELTELIKQFQEFIESDKELLLKAKNCEKHLLVNFIELIKFSPELGDALLDDAETLKCFNESIKEIRKGEDSKNIIVRFYNINISNIRIRDIRVNNFGKFKTITGIIRQISSPYGVVVNIVRI